LFHALYQNLHFNIPGCPPSTAKNKKGTRNFKTKKLFAIKTITNLNGGQRYENGV